MCRVTVDPTDHAVDIALHRIAGRGLQYLEPAVEPDSRDMTGFFGQHVAADQSAVIGYRIGVAGSVRRIDFQQSRLAVAPHGGLIKVPVRETRDGNWQRIAERRWDADDLNGPRQNWWW